MNVLPPDMHEGWARPKGWTQPSALFRIIRFVLLHPKFWISNLDTHFKKRVVPEIHQRLDAVQDMDTMNVDGLLATFDELLEITRLHIQSIGCDGTFSRTEQHREGEIAPTDVRS
jgi:hypothetical protein